MKRKLLALLLVLCLCFSMLPTAFAAQRDETIRPCLDDNETEFDDLTPPETTDPTDPEVTEPEVTEPEVTEPEVTEPEVTEPEVTEPEVTEPEVTEPEVTEPEVTEPEVTEPEVTEPEVTEPEVTEPEVTEPEVTEPEVTEPEVTEPEVTEPEVTEPEVTEPEVTEPEVTEPEVTEPLENITWSFDEDSGVLIISGAGEMTQPEDGYPWLVHKDEITGIAFGKDLTHIGDYAFMGCTALTTVTVPETVDYIGHNAFFRCTALETAVISDGVTLMGSSVFEDCTALTDVTLPSTVTVLSYTFAGCTALETAVIPEGIEELDSVFAQCYALKTVTLPKTLKSITRLFADCRSLESLELPEGLEIIGSATFAGCVSLNGLTIPSTVTSIGSECFSDGKDEAEVYQPGVNPIIFTGDAPDFADDAFDGNTFTRTVTCYYPAGNETWTEDVMLDYGGDVEWVSYEPGTTPVVPSDPYDGTCGANAFWRFDAETGTLTIFGSGEVDAVADTAPWFDHRFDITAVVVEEGITAIGKSAFDSFSKVSALTLPSTLVSIGDRAFGGTAIKTLNLPEGLTTIGKSAFCYIDVTELVLPDSVTTIGDSAFIECENLVKLTLPAGLVNCGNNAFRGCAALKDVTMPKMPDLEHLGNSLFTGTAIDSISWFKGDEIGFQMFACTELTEAILPYCVTSIYNFGFQDCEKLSEIIIHAGVESIGDCAFSGCTALKEVYFEGDAPAIGLTIFQNVETPITCYYPRGNSTWTEAVRQAMGDNVKLVAYTPAERPDPSAPFTDVKQTDYFYEPVLWAVDRGITGGTSATTFSPHAACTRGQIVTFLWAAEGRPEPQSTTNPFTDVKESDYFYKAVLWAVEKGVTGGTSATTFSPNAVCTRGQVVTFLWAAKGRPEPTAVENTFSDVKQTDYFRTAVLWAVENGITGGIGNGKFGPGNTCTRGQIVTFLYKAYN